MPNTPTSTPARNAGAPGKKISPLVWILGGIAVLMLGVMATCGIVGYMTVRAVKNAGFDPELMKRNPGLAMTKMASVLHPDLEVVSTDERGRRITLRQKSTGKLVTFRFDPDQQTLVLTGQDGKDVSSPSSGTGGVTLKSNESTVTIGNPAANKPPEWMPVYPGSTPHGAYSAKTPQGLQSAFTFKTKDAGPKVVEYYSGAFKAAGFAVTQAISSDAGGMISAENADKKQTAVITVASANAETQVSVTSIEKK